MGRGRTPHLQADDDDDRSATPRRAFVVCPNYHGATLLATLLNYSPEIVHLGDTNPPVTSGVESCSCGATVDECDFWQGLRRRLDLPDHPVYRKWMPRFPAYSGRYRLDWLLALSAAAVNRVAGRPLDARLSATARQFREVHDGLARYASERTGAHLFIDGEKSLAKALCLSTADAGRARVIHLVRDPRGFAWSSLGRGRGTPASLARDWRRGHDAIRWGLRLLPSESVLRVRYEDIALDPDGEARRLGRFLGVNVPQGGSSEREVVPARHVIGNPMILNFDGAIRLDEKWRSGLDERDVETIMRGAGNFAKKVGYE